jgi:hypothetical protein
LIGGKRLKTFSEPPDKVFGLTSRGLSGHCLHETEHVLGAMIDLTHQKANLLLDPFSRSNVADDLRGTGNAAFGIAHGREGD